MLRVRLLLPLLLCGLRPSADGQQLADTSWHPHVVRPAFPTGSGPVVYIDEAHHNFHTAEGRFAPFAHLLTADGFRVRRFQSRFDQASLDSIGILVISNALAAANADNWGRPVNAAFAESEISALENWVRRGGALLLIADHMPMAGAAMTLGARFGVPFIDGFAIDPKGWVTVFRRSDGSLANHAITNGRSPAERVDSIATFTGSAFLHTVAVDTLLTLPEGTRVLLPQVAHQFSDSTPYLLGSHLLQGAVRQVGRGRLAIFAEAGMFTAQRQTGGGPMGLNDPRAGGNAQFILNLLHWMTGLLQGQHSSR